eukprot:COSAG02_NODE_12394_length_1553_cov_8.350069_1_plen_94_part_00
MKRHHSKIAHNDEVHGIGVLSRSLSLAPSAAADDDDDGGGGRRGLDTVLGRSTGKGLALPTRIKIQGLSRHWRGRPLAVQAAVYVRIGAVVRC